MKSIKASDIGNYKLIDTINKLDVYSDKKTAPIAVAITNPEVYLIQDFDNSIGTISIAVKDSETFKVYELFSDHQAVGNRVSDTLNPGKLRHLDIMSAPKLKIKALERIKLDNFKSAELVLKFSYQTIGCPNCNQSQAHTTNGYLLFDFDKLQVLKLINFDATSLAQQLDYLENAENFKIEFGNNYVKIKGRNYRYNHNRLVLK
ncbi:hypothetical protein [Flavobacterium sp.]|uniref:hypothetical protein n=1 Tax=Flavobacterium sp. TaxID=239 RepID=UPI001227A059|nr:hypothetical protein [Flavobacterium sp.]RZJ71457.1 MAG: hypothetical protein EOO49_10380 [Flavobacterium sp.]